MISNLFEEYKFFPKYPDKQLKIAAVLFGKHIFILIGLHKPFTVYIFSLKHAGNCVKLQYEEDDLLQLVC
jgi:hypothetical protein